MDEREPKTIPEKTKSGDVGSKPLNAKYTTFIEFFCCDKSMTPTDQNNSSIFLADLNIPREIGHILIFQLLFTLGQSKLWYIIY